MEILTPEEKNLAYVYESPNRTNLICDIKISLPYALYPDVIKLMRTTVEKLEHMTDEEYADTGLSATKIIYEQEA